MATRLEIQKMLEDFLGSREVYYQTPASIRMTYPAIVYDRATYNTRPADDRIYIVHPMYTVTIMYLDPDSDLPSRMLEEFRCRNSRHYVSDNLYHDVFELF